MIPFSSQLTNGIDKKPANRPECSARRRSAASRACQPRRLKLQAAGFVRPAQLLGCSEKSPRQARAVITMIT
jgi:hypothetical protein